jgi:competence protein ComEC
MVLGWLGGVAPAPIAVRVGEVRTTGAVSWRVVWPRRVIRAGSVPNNASVGIVLEAAGTTLLLTGDVEVEAQTAIIAAEPNLRVDVVKVPHHGSRNQDRRLPAWSGGRVALVSVGLGNTYGHPAPETLDAWHQAGALVGRTDEQGDLAVVRADAGSLGLVVRGGSG